MQGADPGVLRRPRPLWQKLASWTIPAIAFLLGAGLWLTMLNMKELSDSAYDRSLAGAIRAIDLNISTESGGVGVELPYPLFESFQTTADGEVFFRVSTDDNLVQIGDALLPPPPDDVSPGSYVFSDARYLGREVRIGVYKRPLQTPLYGAPTAQNIIIEVAETTGSRQAFRDEIFRRALWRDAAVVFASILFLALGAHVAIRPLASLQERLERRDPQDRTRLVPPARLPSEVVPLVAALNGLIDRYREQGEAQRRFIDDASHQLKTPIAVLRAQIDYALAETAPEARTEALLSMRTVVERAGRTMTQLLALARAKNARLLTNQPDGVPSPEALLTDVARLHLSRARQRRIAIEVEMAGPDRPMPGQRDLLFEALSNLVDNAIRHSLPGGRVILRTEPAADARSIALTVLDEGPGFQDADISLPRERFHEAGDRSPSGGSGLGLAIAEAIARAHGGSLRLANREPTGAAATIDLPLPAFAR